MATLAKLLKKYYEPANLGLEAHIAATSVIIEEALKQFQILIDSGTPDSQSLDNVLEILREIKFVGESLGLYIIDCLTSVTEDEYPEELQKHIKAYVPTENPPAVANMLLRAGDAAHAVLKRGYTTQDDVNFVFISELINNLADLSIEAIGFKLTPDMSFNTYLSLTETNLKTISNLASRAYEFDADTVSNSFFEKLNEVATVQLQCNDYHSEFHQRWFNLLNSSVAKAIRDSELVGPTKFVFR